MTIDEARVIALDQPGAIESSHHGHPDFRVGTSIFATLRPADGRSVLRLPEAFAESVEQEKPDRFKVVSRSKGQGWLSVDLARIEASDFRPLIEIAHQHLLAGMAKGK